jgi:lipopolysaccharide transport system ATP-binding protein
MSKPIIKVEKLSKVYTIGHQNQAQYDTLRDNLGRMVRKPIELFTGQRLEKEELWALKEVSFDVQRGDVVGIIGRNGSGKSTLLKVLSQITEPTDGQATLRGRAASLLEVGTGFHPELTGRENIFLNGAILGMRKREIERKFDEIVVFSEVEKFLDTPVKFYSSGMYVRLAFAVAAHLDPDILIVDEVLAVGDAEFQKRSLGKMKEVSLNEGRTVLFVSHNLSSVMQLCTKGILLESGRTEGVMDVRQSVRNYLRQGQAQDAVEFPPEGETYIQRAKVKASSGQLELELELRGGNRLPEIVVSFVVYDHSFTPIYSSDARQDPSIVSPLKTTKDQSRVLVKILEPALRSGTYLISLWVGSKERNYWHRLHCLRVQVEDTRSIQPSDEVGHIIPKTRWELQEES